MSAEWEQCYLVARGPAGALDALREAVRGEEHALDFTLALPIKEGFLGATGAIAKERARKLYTSYAYNPDEPASNFPGLRMRDLVFRLQLGDLAAWAGAGMVLGNIDEGTWGQVGQYNMQLAWLCDAHPYGDWGEPGETWPSIAPAEELAVDGEPALRWRFLTRRYIPYPVLGRLGADHPQLHFTLIHEAPEDCWEGPRDCWLMAEVWHEGEQRRERLTALDASASRQQHAAAVALSGDELYGDEVQRTDDPSVSVPKVAARDAKPAKEPAKKLKTSRKMKALLKETCELTEDYEALSKRVGKLNRKLEKLDPAEDRQTAEELEEAVLRLSGLNEAVADFSSITSDPWGYVTDTLNEAAKLARDGRDDEADALVAELLDLEEYSTRLREDWAELRQLYDDGALNNSRAEHRCAELQDQFEAVFDKLRFSVPYPHASPGYW